MSNLMSRYWVNQPSSLQPDHNLHGSLVIGPRELPNNGHVTVYFTEGNIISSMVRVSALSPGWPSHLTSRQTCPSC
jgi:hypothetical protein